MFQLHDTTRRRICLAAFFLFCLLPTLLVAGWGMLRRSSWHVAAEADRLTALSGLKASLSGIRYVRPGEVVYEGLDLTDPETGGKVLHCRSLTATWTLPEANSPACPVLTLTASQLEVFFDPLVRQAERLAERLLSKRPDAPSTVRLVAQEAVLGVADASQPLGAVLGRAEFEPDASRVECQFRWGGNDQGGPVRLQVVRNRLTTPPATGFELDTGTTPLPCSLLAAACPGLGMLGPRSQFRGNCWGNETPDGWAMELKDSQLTDVDLELLLGGRLPHRLTGLAQISLVLACFRGERIEKAHGEFAAGPGVVSRSLIHAAVERLGLSAGPAEDTSAPQTHYEHLGFRFYFDSRGLWLQSLCDAGNVRAILVEGKRPLLGEPGFQPQPIGALVQALVSPGSIQVPATQQVAWLMRRVPLPEAPVVQPLPLDATLPQSQQR